MLLYSTLGCHLCEQAKIVLWPLLAKYQLRLTEIDISLSDDMIDRYGTRIPVIALSGYPAELDWPFTHEQADRFLSALNQPQ